MKQLLLTTIIACVATIQSLSQPRANAGDDSLHMNQKFYLPVSSYQDSVRFSKAMVRLAGQILRVYKESNKKTYFENSIAYYLLAGDYKKGAALIDSVQSMNDDRSFDLELRSYAFAQIGSEVKPGLFEQIFKKEFVNAFNSLSFVKKAYVASIDSLEWSYSTTDYTSEKSNLQKNNNDSLSLKDARSLAEKYLNYFVYNRISPLIPPLIDSRYRETFPAIKGSKWGGVVPVELIDEQADSNMKYKLLFELTGFALKGQDSAAKTEINNGLSEVARVINLHEAAGVPKRNIEVVIVAHGPALDIFFTNEKYRLKYQSDNPNIPLIKELMDYGVKIIVCGQAMTFLRRERTDLLPGIREALTAQTVLSTYQLKNYVHYDEALRDDN